MTVKTRRVLLGVGILATSAMLLAACGPSKNASTSGTKLDTAELKPYGKYKKPMTFTYGRQQRVKDSLAKGDTLTNNPATRWLKQETNITVKPAWEAADFTQKVSLVMSTGDLPDVMTVYQDQYNQLLQNGLLEDLTTVYKKAASPLVKKNIASYDQDVLKIASQDGKLMAIPSPYPYNEENILWIRKDWLDKLHLPVPETIDDLENVAKQFVDKDVSGTGKTVGITLSPTISGGDGSQMDAGLIFNQYNAFPSHFIKKDGKVVYGSVEPETKQVLQMLARWYKEGIIDKEFATRTDDEKKALLAKNMGIYIAPFWGLDFLNSYEADKNANWIPITGPVKEKGDKFISTHPAPVFRYVVVKKGFAHPEAVMRAINNVTDFLANTGKAAKFRQAEAKKVGMKDVSMDWYLAPIDVQITNAYKNKQGYDQLEKALKTNDPSILPAGGGDTYKDIKAFEKNRDPKGLSAYLGHVGVGASTENDKIDFVDLAYYGNTKTMVQKGANLKKLEDETFIKIIMGQAPISSFDTFVTQWKAQGGTDALKEVQTAVDKGQVQ
ncbi:extracellular solute-binding protein [Schleiferilactobacillus shenzhenensis]|uniref:Uncharacterized protein n=1 Tax=Schleiferilactobacillus shenzhenensis LY-73 TaxID=1231336 RepID=U4THU1_9LACO|nr:extracellular solute-binding protein [Schleiferilactobacillus shenzhenensis]ERL63739.1 hypothetical protein L248_2236 [Schleiferilactobacillus shenzhenensis LY-73]